jgi:transcriptional regulator with XRE-family HTH domain
MISERIGIQTGYFCLVKFGEGLYAWRVYRGFTQEELGAKGDVTNDTISKYEIKPGDRRDPGEPSPRIRSKLAKALGITPEQFFTFPTTLPEQEESIDDVFDKVRSLYGSGKYTKEQIRREALKFLLEIEAQEKERGEGN